MNFVRYITSAIRVPAGTRAISHTSITAQNIDTSVTATAQPEVESPVPRTNASTDVHEPAAQTSARYKFEPLDPPLPVKSGWPTPWINQNDFEKYLGPLYHRGWGVRYLYPREKGKRTSAELFANYRFVTYTAATNFIQAVGQIAVSEKHHPRLLAVSCKRTPEVALYTLTHSAHYSRSAELPAGELPGITVRDVRLAILADKLYTEEYAGKVHGPRILAPLTRKPYWPDFVNHLNAIYNPSTREKRRGPPIPFPFAHSNASPRQSTASSTSEGHEPSEAS